LLVEILAPHYPPTHQVVIYEAASMPFEQPRMDWISLGDLPTVRLTLKSTLVLPPSQPLQKNTQMLARLQAMQAS